MPLSSKHLYVGWMPNAKHFLLIPNNFFCHWTFLWFLFGRIKFEETILSATIKVSSFQRFVTGGKTTHSHDSQAGSQPVRMLLWMSSGSIWCKTDNGDVLRIWKFWSLYNACYNRKIVKREVNMLSNYVIYW